MAENDFIYTFINYTNGRVVHTSFRHACEMFKVAQKNNHSASIIKPNYEDYVRCENGQITSIEGKQIVGGAGQYLINLDDEEY